MTDIQIKMWSQSPGYRDWYSNRDRANPSSDTGKTSPLKSSGSRISPWGSNSYLGFRILFLCLLAGIARTIGQIGTPLPEMSRSAFLVVIDIIQTFSLRAHLRYLFWRSLFFSLWRRTSLLVTGEYDRSVEYWLPGVVRRERYW